MGNIRPTYIKRVAVELIQKYPEAFSDDFEANKLSVNALADATTVKMRNRIAGYATRYRRQVEL
ncbi:MAG: 30S ribosomal protein S17e [Candidatus Methanomethylophilaceae archaeon]|jgi:small subunit ribosomal protein S17e